jgi:hypothetical protein
MDDDSSDDDDDDYHVPLVAEDGQKLRCGGVN